MCSQSAAAVASAVPTVTGHTALHNDIKPVVDRHDPCWGGGGSGKRQLWKT